MSNSDFIEAGTISHDGSGQKRQIKHIIIHPFYNERKIPTYDFDIAILKLSSPLIFEANVQPACLPDVSFAPDKTKQMALISGWGDTSFSKIYSYLINFFIIFSGLKQNLATF